MSTVAWTEVCNAINTSVIIPQLHGIPQAVAMINLRALLSTADALGRCNNNKEE